MCNRKCVIVYDTFWYCEIDHKEDGKIGHYMHSESSNCKTEFFTYGSYQIHIYYSLNDELVDIFIFRRSSFDHKIALNISKDTFKYLNFEPQYLENFFNKLDRLAVFY